MVDMQAALPQLLDAVLHKTAAAAACGSLTGLGARLSSEHERQLLSLQGSPLPLLLLCQANAAWLQLQRGSAGALTCQLLLAWVQLGLT